jgi:integrase
MDRDFIEKWEMVKLFAPGVIADPLQKAVCAAMFWAGLRRSEIFGLKPEDLDWQAAMIRVRNARFKHLLFRACCFNSPDYYRHNRVIVYLYQQKPVTNKAPEAGKYRRRR